MKRGTPEEASKAKNSRLLLVGLIVFYGLPVVGVIIGYGFGQEDIGFMCGAYLMVAVPAGVLLAIVSGIAFMIQDSVAKNKPRQGRDSSEK